MISRIWLSLKVFFTSLLIIGLISCTSNQLSVTSIISSPVPLTPYISPSPTQDLIINTPFVVTPTDLPTPTPTPIIYTIVEGDTMLAIALRHSVSLEELQAVNPEVNPSLLSIGTELIIPLGNSLPSSPATTTPIPIETARPDCYSVVDGIWCFLLVMNGRARDLENISARIILYDERGEMFVEGIAVPPVNKLPEDEQIPLVIFFPANHTGPIQATSNLISAQPVPKNDPRYLNAWLEVDDVEISTNGMQAVVRGSIGIPKKSVPGNLVWIVATAYDGEGKVVGVRKLEQFDLLEPGASRDFEIEVFSLGPKIGEVEAIVEVRP